MKIRRLTLKFLKNVYIIIRYFGFDYFRAVYEHYKTDKDAYDNFAECVQDELYALADSM